METEKKGKKKNVFFRHFMFVVFLFAAGTILAYMIYLLIPGEYQAVSTILKPADSKLIQEKAIEKEDIAGTSGNTELLLAILNSRKMKEDIVEEFDLVKAYRTKDMHRALDMVSKRTVIDSKHEALISIKFRDSKPERAAEIANYYIENLKSSLYDIYVLNFDAGELGWIEKRLEEIGADIDVLDSNLLKLQEENSIVVDKNLTQFTRLTGRLVEELYIKKLSLERELALPGGQADRTTTLKKEIEITENMLGRLALLKEDFTAVKRQLEQQEELYSFFNARLEEARMSEFVKKPVVHVLDKAAVPQRLTKPELGFLFIVNTIIVGMIAVVIFFFDLLKYLGSI